MPRCLSTWQNLGTIKCSNLCTEIVEYTSPDEVAVCNLASIGLPMFIAQDKTFDHQKLMEITKVITRNLNKVIDVKDYEGSEKAWRIVKEFAWEHQMPLQTELRIGGKKLQ